MFAGCPLWGSSLELSISYQDKTGKTTTVGVGKISASKSTHLHDSPSFSCIFPFQKVFFPTILARFRVKNPTPTVAFLKNFFRFGHKKIGMLSCTPVIRRMYVALSHLCRPQCGPNRLYWLCPRRLGRKVSLIPFSPEQRREPLFPEDILAPFYRDLF